MKILWTDGSANPNPGPGGFVVIEKFDHFARPVKIGHEARSTNIRMEGMAIIAAMEYAGDDGCEIHTDSRFWIDTITKWAPSWEARGWTKKTGEIKNLDLVKKAYELYRKYPVTLIWVKGHDGLMLNELADEWAKRAREGAKLAKI